MPSHLPTHCGTQPIGVCNGPLPVGYGGGGGGGGGVWAVTAGGERSVTENMLFRHELFTSHQLRVEACS